MLARWCFAVLMIGIVCAYGQEALVITQQPESQTNQIGTDAALTVAATGAEPLSYQWFFNETNLLAEATNSTLTLTNVQPAQAGSYNAVVSNATASATSQVAVLTVVVPPFITQQPASLTVTQGQTANFAVGAGGDSPLAYQWLFNDLELAGETQDTLVLESAQPQNAGSYQVIVSNSVGVVTSTVATLTVHTFDFGDAPPMYPSLSVDNGARHLIVPGVHLGLDIDYEADAPVDAMATGDDLDGMDDEDGISFTSPLRAGQIATITVVASTNGLLQGWIDVDGDQSWSQPSDLVLRDFPLIAGDNEVSFRVPVTVSVMHTFARFRFSTSPVGFDGPAPNGEVEDYAVVLDPVVDLFVTGSDQPDPVVVGSNVTYSIAVSNRGLSTATDVILSDTLPQGLQFVSVTTSQGSCTNMDGSVSCYLGSLSPSNTINVSIVARAAAPGFFTNTATVINSEFDSDPSNNTAVQVTTAVIATRRFSNPETLFKDEILRGPFEPYPSTIQVSGLTASVHKVTVTLHNLSHSFPDDLDILLVGPGERTVMLMSDAGSNSNLVDVTLTFDDAASEAVPNSTQIFSGTYRPTNYPVLNETNPPPAPLPPYGANLSVFNGTDPNGGWSLYVADDQPEDGGVIADGWSLNITTIHPIADLVATIRDEPDPGAAGTNLRYVVTFTNKGPANASGVVLTDRLPESVAFVSIESSVGVCTNDNGLITCQIGNLANGQGGVLTLVATPSLDGVYTNTAILTANELDLTPQDGRATAITTIAPVTDLGIKLMAASPQPALLEQLLVYTIVVTNGGPSTATGVTLSDALPAGFTFVSGEFGAGGCTNVENTVTCSLPSLASQAEAVATIRCRPHVLGTFTNTVNVSSPDFDRNATNNDASVVSTVVENAEVVVNALASPEPVGLGQPLLYLIGISNAGPVVATDVTLQNVLPAGVVVDAITSSHGACTNDNGTINCALGTLAVGEFATLRLDVKPQAVGAISNHVSVSSNPIDPNLSNNIASVMTTVVPAADVGLAVSEFPDPVWNGERLRYIVTVSNDGPSTASGVVVRDRFPTSAGLISAVASQGGCSNFAGVVTCALGNIATGQTATVTLILQPLGTSVRTNQASVTANELDPNPANNQREDTTTVIIPTASVSTTNSVAVPDVGAGLPYPSTIFVSGITAAVREVRISLVTLRHTFPDDLDILLVGPNGRAALLMSDAGGDFSLSGETLTFLDGALEPLPDATRISTGRYRPTDHQPEAVDSFPPPAPPGPYGTNLSVFSGIDPNGPWSLYIVDDFTKDSGTLANGWRVDFTTSEPIADVEVSALDLPEFVAVGSNRLYTIIVTNRGPAAATQVRLTNEVPAELGLQLVTPNQGSCTVIGGVVTCDLGTIPARSNAVVQISYMPSSVATVTNPMTALGAELDLNPVNNTTQAVVQIQEPPFIIFQPQNQVMTNAGQAVFSVTATGSEPLLFQWQRNGADLMNETNSELVLSSIVPADEGQYRVRVHNLVGAVLSEPATLIVSGLPVISDVPDQTVVEDTTSTEIPFTVGDEENPAESLQLRGFSSNGSVIDATGILFGGSGSNRTVALTPMSNAVGAAVVTIEVVNPHGGSKSDQFTLTIQPVNDPPFIIGTGDRSTPEDTPLEIPFSLGDVDSPLEGLTLTYSSSNPALLPDANIVLGGADGNRSVMLSPVADQFGVSVITLSAADDVGAIFRSIFRVSVQSVNDRPTLSPVADVIIDEDSAPEPVSLAGISSGASNEMQRLRVTATSSDPAVIPHPVVEYASPANSGTLTFSPYPNASGSAMISVMVHDGEAENATITQTFSVEVRPANDAPTISDIADHSIFEDGSLAIPFIVADADGSNAVAALTVSAISSNTSLLPQTGIVFSGTNANRNLRLTPAANEFGGTIVTVTVTDTNGASATDSFELTVLPVNDPPTLATISNVAVGEDTAARVINLTGISPGPNNESNQVVTLSAASSNPGLIGNPAVSYSSPAAAGTLTFQPAPNSNGSSVISVTANDGENAIIVRQFTVTVNGSNDPPVIEAIADVSTQEDTPVTVAVNVADSDMAPLLLAVSASSGNTNLAPNSGLFINGSGSNRFLTVVPSQNRSGTGSVTVVVSDGVTNAATTFALVVAPVNDPPTLNPISSITVVEGSGAFNVALEGITSGATNETQTLAVSATSSNASLVAVQAINYTNGNSTGTLRLATALTGTGSAVVAVNVNDGGASNNLATRHFTVFVTPAGNSSPSITDIADTNIVEDTQLGPVSFTIGDAETPAAELVVAAHSSNPVLIPNENITLEGADSNRTVTLLPALNQAGTTLITVSVTDGQFRQIVDTFMVTVAPTNDPPAISSISDQTIGEDTPLLAVPFTVDDAESPASSLTVTAQSSVPGVVSNAHLAVTGQGTNRTLVITPLTNRNGITTITLAAGDGLTNRTRTFSLTILSTNDPPSLAPLADQTAREDTLKIFGCFLGDPDTPLNNLTLSASCSNPALVPDGNIRFTGNGAERALLLMPATNQFGTATLTVVVSDNQGGTATQSCVLIVSPVNEPPLLDQPANIRVSQLGGPVSVALTGISAGPEEAQVLSISVASSHPGIVANAAVDYATGSTGTLNLTVVPGAQGTASVVVTVNDGQTENNLATRTFSVTIDEAPQVSQIPDQQVQLNSSIPPITFTIGDVETAADALVVSVSSDNEALVPAAGLVLGGTDSNRNLTITPGGQTGSAFITVTVTDGLSNSTPSSFVVTVTLLVDPPVIVTQPQGQTVARGQTATLQVEANGTGLRYQWQRDGMELPGQISASLVLSPAEVSDTGNYVVVVSNDGGSVTSAAATLRVVIAPEIVEILHLGTAAHISFTTTVGQNYVLEYQDMLSDAPWTPLITVAGDGNEVTIEDPAPPATRFYRVRVE